MPNDKRDKYKAASEALTIAFTFPIAIALGYLLGRWLDKTFNTHPWLTGVCTLLGIAAAFTQLFRIGRTNDGSGGGKE